MLDTSSFKCLSAQHRIELWVVFFKHKTSKIFALPKHIGIAIFPAQILAKIPFYDKEYFYKKLDLN